MHNHDNRKRIQGAWIDVGDNVDCNNTYNVDSGDCANLDGADDGYVSDENSVTNVM